MLESIVISMYNTVSPLKLTDIADAYNLRINVNPKLIKKDVLQSSDVSNLIFDLDQTKLPNFISPVGYKKSDDVFQFTISINNLSSFVSDFEDFLLHNRYLDAYLYSTPLAPFGVQLINKSVAYLRRIRSSKNIIMNIHYVYTDTEVDANGKKVFKTKLIKNLIYDNTYKSISIQIDSDIELDTTNKIKLILDQTL